MPWTLSASLFCQWIIGATMTPVQATTLIFNASSGNGDAFFPAHTRWWGLAYTLSWLRRRLSRMPACARLFVHLHAVVAVGCPRFPASHSGLKWERERKIGGIGKKIWATLLSHDIDAMLADDMVYHVRSICETKGHRLFMHHLKTSWTKKIHFQS